MWVKVCGVKRRADVEAACRSGADAIGLVLAASPRRVTPEQAKELAAMADGTSTYLLTVDATAGEILDLADFCGVSGVQPYGTHAAESAAAAVKAGLDVLRPVAVSTSVEVGEVPHDQTPLLDAGHLGGTGTSFDWALADGIERRFVLAGGLGPDNVRRAIEVARPWGVDASSALESSPGAKDPDLIRRFVEQARTT